MTELEAGAGGRQHRRPVAVDSTGREVACSADREDTGSMDFPAYVWLGPLAIHPHWLFESVAYLVGARVYAWNARATAIRSPRLIAGAGRRGGGRRGRDRRQAALLGIRADVMLERWHDPFFLFVARVSSAA